MRFPTRVNTLTSYGISVKNQTDIRQMHPGRSHAYLRMVQAFQRLEAQFVTVGIMVQDTEMLRGHCFRLILIV